jgi:hypothetical protein
MRKELQIRGNLHNVAGIVRTKRKHSACSRQRAPPAGSRRCVHRQGGLLLLVIRRRNGPKPGQWAEAVLTDACSTLAMPQIDLLLAAELLVVLLLVATMDANSPRAGAAEPPLEEPETPLQWTAETDLHAQRILRLESRRTAGLAPLR